jgi:hypothetical protein
VRSVVLGVTACLACGRIGFGALSPADARGDATLGDGPAMPDAEVAPLECSSTALVCDDFETGAGTEWTLSGQVTRTAMAHTGSGALRAHVDAIGAGGSAAALISEGTSFVNQNGTTFWVRAWIQLASLPAAGNAVQVAETDELGNGVTGDAVLAASNATAVYSSYANQAMRWPQPLATDQWLCVIWEVNLSPGSSGLLALSQDAPALQLDAATDGTPPVGTLAIGLDFQGSNVAASNGAMDLLIDDVVVDDKVVACD